MKRKKAAGKAGKLDKLDKNAKGVAAVGHIKGQGTRKFRKSRAGG